MKQRKILALVVLVFLLLIMIIIALYSGHAHAQSFQDPIERVILVKIRLPRILLAIAVGIALSLSGHTMQILLNNPLASGSTLGMSSGAAFGASVAIYLNMRYGLHISHQITAVLSALLTLLVVLRVASHRGAFHATNVVLAGVIVSTILSSGITFIKYLADEQVAGIIAFLMGSLGGASLASALVFLTVVLLATGGFYRWRKELDVMMMGREEALIVGLEYDRYYKVLVIATSVLIALSVSLSGIIGFVGLITPHIGRMLVGSSNRRCLPIIVLLGALFLLSADTVVRAYLPHAVPVGILTTLIGGPFFLYLYQGRRSIT